MTSIIRSALVLGAKGFVGRHVCRALADSGIGVTGLGHGQWQGDDLAAWGLSHWVEGEIDLPTLESLKLDMFPDVLIHCGGSGAVSFSYANPLDDFHRSVDSTAAVLEWVRRSGSASSRVVAVSSAAVYGDQGDVDLTEMATRSPVSPYGFHKLAAESLCDSYSRFFGIKVSIVRLFSVFGEGLRKQLLWDALNKFERGQFQFFGTGNELRDWIHVDDAARLLCAAASAPQADFEVYNGGNEHADIRDVLSRLATACGIGHVPEFNGQTHTGNPRRLTSNCGHARRQLGWHPGVSLTDGLSRYAAWFRQGSPSDVAPA